MPAPNEGCNSAVIRFVVIVGEPFHLVAEAQDLSQRRIAKLKRSLNRNERSGYIQNGETMGSDFAEKLAAVLPERIRLFYAPGRKHPPYNDLGVLDTFSKFKNEFLPQCPLKDPLGRQIQVGTINFRKLLNLKHKELGDAARAWKIIEEIEEGLFDASKYDLPRDRIRTLFWIPEIIIDPDAIYRNNHPNIKADEVFVCVYDKDGSKVKLVFTAAFGKKPAQRVEIVTSYLTNSGDAIKCIKGEPLYVRPK